MYKRANATFLINGGMSQRLESPRAGSQTCAAQQFKNANVGTEYEKIAEMGFEKWDLQKVVSCKDHALEFAPACHHFKILKAKYLAMLGHYPEVLSVASDILQVYSTNADGLQVWSLCLY